MAQTLCEVVALALELVTKCQHRGHSPGVRCSRLPPLLPRPEVIIEPLEIRYQILGDKNKLTVYVGPDGVSETHGFRLFA